MQLAIDQRLLPVRDQVLFGATVTYAAPLLADAAAGPRPLVALAEEIRERGDREQRHGHVPRRLHCGSQPGTGLERALCNHAEVALQARDLSGLTLAFHEG